jgi:hypothetical protein
MCGPHGFVFLPCFGCLNSGQSVHDAGHPWTYRPARWAATICRKSNLDAGLRLCLLKADDEPYFDEPYFAASAGATTGPGDPLY